MKRSILVLFLIFLTFSPLIASGTNHPKAGIYTDIDRWHNLGLITALPPIRPYPAQYLISILEQVILKGDKKDIAAAQLYLTYYTNTNLDITIKHNSFTNMDEYQTISGLGIDANLNLKDWVSAGIDINVYLMNRVEESITAPNRSTGIDVNTDNSGISAFGMYWDIFQGLNLNAAFGSDKLWFQTGMMPSSFGPLFSDSVVMNPNAKQAAHFSYTWIEDNFTVSYLFLPIVATNSIGEKESDDKYVHIRSLDFRLTNWWEFQFYETAVYGGKGVKPIFFLPFSELFYSAGMGGTWDVNSQLGLSSRFQFPQNISLKGTVYVDDANANELMKLNFDTKLKMATQFELNWTPTKSILNSISLNYTAILPYMYTHTTEADKDSDFFDIYNTIYEKRSFALSEYMNYENYTNGGLSMGPYGMEPNSDKIGLNVSFDIPKGFTVNFNSEFRRHGNSSSTEDRSYDTSIFDEMSEEDVANFYEKYDTDKNGVIDDAVDTDGTIFDTGYGWTGGYLYQNSSPFLSQDILEMLLVNELTIISPKFDIGKGELFGELSYSHIYIQNMNLDKDEDKTGSYIRFSLSYKL